MYASAIGVTRLVAPGPEVAMHTPTLPVACAYPVAAWPPPCSWRTRMWRTFESNSGSYAGRIAPPGMPNTTSTPSASSERTSALAPDIGASETTAPPDATPCAVAGCAAVAPVAAGGAGRWARTSGVGLLISFGFRNRVGHGGLVRALKKPACGVHGG